MFENIVNSEDTPYNITTVCKVHTTGKISQQSIFIDAKVAADVNEQGKGLQYPFEGIVVINKDDLNLLISKVSNKIGIYMYS